MKLQPDRAPTLSIQAHGPGWLQINGQRYHHSIWVSSSGQINAWPPATPQDLQVADFECLAQDSPELVLYGSGERLRFPPAPLLRPLIERGVGLETMDTLAAARTFNFLASEGRRVVAALMVRPVEDLDSD